MRQGQGAAASLTHLERAWRRVQHLVQVGRTTTAPTDGGNIQTVQIKTSDAAIRDAVPVTYHYGLTAVIPVGTDVIVLNVSGDSSNGVIVSTGHQTSRPKGLRVGQVALYDLTGSMVLMDNAGGMVLTPSGGTVTVNGKLVVTGDATIGGKDFLGHVHGGVQGGTSDTGIPA